MKPRVAAVNHPTLNSHSKRQRPDRTPTQQRAGLDNERTNGLRDLFRACLKCQRQAVNIELNPFFQDETW